MPAQSEAERRYLNWKFGHAWVEKHHFDNHGRLPEHVKTAKRVLKRHKKRRGRLG